MVRKKSGKKRKREVQSESEDDGDVSDSDVEDSKDSKNKDDDTKQMKIQLRKDAKKRKLFDEVNLALVDESQYEPVEITKEDEQFVNQNLNTLNFIQDIDASELAPHRSKLRRIKQLRAQVSSYGVIKKDKESIELLKKYKEKIIPKNSGITVKDLLGDDYDENEFEKRKSKNDESEGLIESYEEKFRRERLPKLLNEQKEEEKEVKLSLPVKTSDGRIVYTNKTVAEPAAITKKKEAKVEQEIKEEIEKEDEEVKAQDKLNRRELKKLKRSELRNELKEAKEIKKLNVKEIVERNGIERYKRIEKIKKSIAETATAVLSSPVEKIKQMETLFEYCDDVDFKVRSLAMLSLVALFKDLIPDYHVNIKNINRDSKVTLSKDVINARYFEGNIVKLYQKYIQLSVSWMKRILKWKSENNQDTIEWLHLQTIAIKGLSEMLLSKPHFNYTSNIIEGLVQKMNFSYKRDNDPAYEFLLQQTMIIYEGLCELFKDDATHGEASLDVVVFIGHYIKRKYYKVVPEMIDCFLYLNISAKLSDVTLPTEIRDRKRIKMQKKKKERQKKLMMTKSLDEVLDEGFEVSRAKLKPNEIKSIQTNILRNVMVCYIRLLKTDKKSPVLFSALAGLSKFANLMNVELLYDLLAYIKEVLTNEIFTDELLKDKDNEDDSVPCRTVLQCLVTTSNLIQGMGEALNIDLNDFYSHLYAVIPKVLSCNPKEEEVNLLVDAIYFLLIKSGTNQPETRIAAFVKRICTYSIHSPIHASYSLFNVLKLLLQRYKKVNNQFRADEESGLEPYDPYTNNPDLSNPYSSSLHEVNIHPSSVTSKHYHPLYSQVIENSIYFERNQNHIKRAKVVTLNELHQIIDKFNPSKCSIYPPIKTPEGFEELEKKIEKRRSKVEQIRKEIEWLEKNNGSKTEIKKKMALLSQASAPPRQNVELRALKGNSAFLKLANEKVSKNDEKLNENIKTLISET